MKGATKQRALKQAPKGLTRHFLRKTKEDGKIKGDAKEKK